MTRVLSALVLVPIVVGVVGWLPPVALLVLAELVLVLALREYLALAERRGARPPAPIVIVAAMALCAAGFRPGARIELTLIAGVFIVLVAALGRAPAGSDPLLAAATGVFGVVYLGGALGSFVRLRMAPEALAPVHLVFFLLLVVMGSDTAQYYTGRAIGRTPLAPAISPQKTVEGTIGGLVAACVLALAVRAVWLPASASKTGAATLGATLALLGIVGDLFESALKRGAGVKDTSTLIPGHGGMLDRIDSLLFATPAFYVYVKYFSQA